MSIVPTLFLGVEYCATFQAALYIETHSLMHQSEFHAAGVALSRAADKRKSLINIHKNGYTATLRPHPAGMKGVVVTPTSRWRSWQWRRVCRASQSASDSATTIVSCYR